MCGGCQEATGSPPRPVSYTHLLFKKLKRGERSPYDISREGLSFLSSCYEVFSDRNPELRTMLTEHYRCHPAIIGFCNEAVYGNELTVKTPVRDGNVPCPIRICWYEGDYREGTWPPGAPPEEDPNKKTRSTCVNRKQLAILRAVSYTHLANATWLLRRAPIKPLSSVRLRKCRITSPTTTPP